MSKGRLNDLRESLIVSGWTLLNETGDQRFDQDIYLVSDEVVTWGIFNENLQIEDILEFHIFGELGGRSEKLNDILYCRSKSRQVDLSFNKRESEMWKNDLPRFIQSLSAKA